MNARLLVAHLGEKSRLWINGEDGNAVFFQSMGGIKEFPIRTNVYVGTTSSTAFVGHQGLHFSELAVVITHNHARSAQLVDEIKIASALVESDMAWSFTTFHLEGHGWLCQHFCSAGGEIKSMYAIVAQVGGQEILAIGSGEPTMDVRNGCRIASTKSCLLGRSL